MSPLRGTLTQERIEVFTVTNEVVFFQFTSTDGDLLVAHTEISHFVEDPDSKGTCMLHLKNGKTYEISGGIHDFTEKINNARVVRG